MGILAPALLALTLLAIPIILLYVLRLRRREVVVSSTYLWRDLTRDRQANTLWQRLRRNLLLFLQLAILAAMVFALARPYFRIPSLAGGNTVVIIDGSASMMASDVEPSRFDEARRIAIDLLKDISGEDQVTVILAGQQPSVIASGRPTREELSSALQATETGTGDVDWESTMALAVGATQGYDNAGLVLISDGGLPELTTRAPANMQFVKVGKHGENVAISSFAAREIEGEQQLLSLIRNFGSETRVVSISIYDLTTLIDSRRIELAAGESRAELWDLEGRSGPIKATLEAGESDGLATDNVAWTVAGGQSAPRTLLVTEGNRFLEAAFGLLPSVEAFKLAPDQLDAQSAAAYELIILDAVEIPEQLPQGDLIIIDPPRSTSWLTIGDYFTPTTPFLTLESPLSLNVDWSDVHIRRARQMSTTWSTDAVSSEEWPLLTYGEWQGRKVALFSFRLQESDLPLQPAFPIVISNLVDWMSPGDIVRTATVSAGDPVFLRGGSGVDSVQVVMPDGEVAPAELVGSQWIFDQSESLGLYEVRQNGGSSPVGWFSINMFSRLESEIAPRDSLSLGRLEVKASGRSEIGQREIWPWLLLAALAVLAIEWWIHFKGLRWPDLAAIGQRLSEEMARIRTGIAGVMR